MLARKGTMKRELVSVIAIGADRTASGGSTVSGHTNRCSRQTFDITQTQKLPKTTAHVILRRLVYFQRPLTPPRGVRCSGLTHT